MKALLLDLCGASLIILFVVSVIMSFPPTRFLVLTVLNIVIWTIVALLGIVAFFRIIFSLQDRFNAYYNRKLLEKRSRTQKGQNDYQSECSYAEDSDIYEECYEDYTRNHYEAHDYEFECAAKKCARVLGVDASNMTEKSLKNAYRTKMKEYHPDRVVSFNLASEFKELAEARAKQINEAYAFLKKRFCT